MYLNAIVLCLARITIDRQYSFARIVAKNLQLFFTKDDIIKNFDAISIQEKYYFVKSI